jgi:glucose/arabinose dehydrogenase
MSHFVPGGSIVVKKFSLAMFAILLFLASASVAAAATTTVSPGKGVRGSHVVLKGHGFRANARVVVKLAGKRVDAVRTNGKGAFRASFRVPRKSTGQKALIASGAGRVVNAFTIVRTRPLKSSSTTADSSGKRITLSPTGGRTGDTVTVQGANYPSGRVTVLFTRKTVARRKVRHGHFTARFKVPESSPGARTVQVRHNGSLRTRFDVACGTAYTICTGYRLGFSTDAGGIRSGNGIGTGFTKVLDGSTLNRRHVKIDPKAGVLEITTNDGLLDQQTQENALGIGVNAANSTNTLSTVVMPPKSALTASNSEQGGIFFGIDDSHFFKLVLISTGSGPKVQLSYMEGGTTTALPLSSSLGTSFKRVALSLTLDAGNLKASGSYSVDGGSSHSLGTMTNIPDKYFNTDAASIDPAIGTRVFGGLFASNRNGPGPLVYGFDSFVITHKGTPPPPPQPGEPAFNRSTIANVAFPTSLAWGPDGRLYALEIGGKIHAFKLDAQKHVVPSKSFTITTLGNRTAIGLTIDPASTPSNVILWVSHSAPCKVTTTGGCTLKDQPGGASTADSSMVSRLRQNNGWKREDIITGLPRSANDHMTNSIHFHNGKLYIAQGSNTGAGATFAGDKEFPSGLVEQKLTAAILVADVKSPSFNGNCHPPSGNEYGTPPCESSGSVTTFATGLRNAYDFVWHSNGNLYSSVNGLGLAGSYPPETSPPCTGLGDSAPWDQGGDNPGVQPDYVARIVQGNYYGHPNPSRGECVFGDGVTFYTTNPGPLPNYDPSLICSMQPLGTHTSSDSSIEYRSNVFGGNLQGDLVIGNWAKDNLADVHINGNGSIDCGALKVLSVPRLSGEPSDFNNPLGLTEGPDGTIYLGETGANRISVLTPKN